MSSPAILYAIDTVGNSRARLPDGSTTDDTRLALVGTAEAGSTVQLFDGNNFVGTTQADAKGYWSWHTPLLQNGGAHAYTARYDGGTPSDAYTVTVVAPMPLAPQTPVRIGTTLNESWSNEGFIGFRADGSVYGWGSGWSVTLSNDVQSPGGGVVQVISHEWAQAVIKADGSMKIWGPYWVGSPPASVSQPGSGVVQVAIHGDISEVGAVAVLKDNGTVVGWGDYYFGGNPPASVTASGSNVVQLLTNGAAFAALKGDGSVVTWGAEHAGSPAPSSAGSNVLQVIPVNAGFLAIKTDGSVVGWGNDYDGGINVPAALGLPGANVVQVYTNDGAYAALKADGSVVAWGESLIGGVAPSSVTAPNSGVVQVFASGGAFTALKADGSAVSWGYYDRGGDSAPLASQLASDVVQVIAGYEAFVALKADGSVVAWGNGVNGGNAPTSITAPGSGVVQVIASHNSFTALKADGTVVSWGNSFNGGQAPASVTAAGSDVVQVFANGAAFAALKSNGTIVSWGNSYVGGVSPPSSISDFVSVASIHGGSHVYTPNAPVLPFLIQDDSGSGAVDLLDGDTTRDDTPTLSGLTEAYAQVGILSNGALLAVVHANAAGNWTYTPATGLDVDATYGFQVRIYSAQGYYVGKSDVLSITLEDGVPAPSFSLTDDSGALDDDGITANGEISVGPLLDGATWEYRINGGDWVDGVGTLFTLDEGEYAAGSIEVRQTLNGEVGLIASNSSAIVVKTTAPVAPSITSAELANSLTPEITGTAEANSTITVTIGDAVYTVQANADGEWTLNLSAQQPDDGTGPLDLDANGGNTISVIATDAAGNPSQAGSQTLVIDTTPPVEPDVTLPPAGDTNVSTILVAGLEADATWEYSLDGGDTWQTGEDGEVPLDDATYAIGQIQVRQVDAAGNPGLAVSNTGVITVDTQAPVPPSITSASLSKSTTPEITGTAENNSTVTITIGDAEYTVQANASGEWTLDLATQQPDAGTGPLDLDANGANTISVIATDAAGNPSHAGTQTLVIDTTAPDEPDVTLPPAGDTNVSTILVAGLEADATWEYSLDGGDTWQTGENGELSLDDDTYTIGQIQLRQIDAAGNPGEIVSNTGVITVDTQAPVPPTINSAELSNSLTPEITGTAEVNSTVTITIGNAVYTVQANTDGEWTLDLATQQPDDGTGPLDLDANGDNTISVIATDAAGNPSHAGTQTLVVDTTAPDEPDVTLPPAGDTNVSTILVAGLEANAAWEYSLDGGDTWHPGQNGEVPLDDGTYTIGQIQLRQIDAAGNPGEIVSNTGAITVDTQAPVPPTIDSDSLSNTLTPEITGTAEVNSTVTITIGNAVYTVQANADGEWTLDLATQQPDDDTGPLDLDANGDNTISVIATDAAGNPSHAGTQTLVIDTTAPDEPDVTLPPAGDTNVSTILVAGLEADATWEYSLDGGDTWHTGQNGQVPLDDGTYTIGQIQLRQIDAAGNPGEIVSNTGAISVDTQAPVPPAILSASLSNTVTPEITGSAEANSTLTITIGDAVYTVQANADGEWTLDLASQQPDSGTGPLALDANGDNTILVTATDAAGNTSDAGEQILVVDTTPPATPRATLPGGGSSSNNVVLVTALEEGALWQYSLDGGSTWRDGSGQRFLIPDGDYRPGHIQVRQLDPAGNPSEPVRTNANVTIDTAPPLAPTLAVSVHDGRTWIEVGRLETSASWHYSLDGGETWLAGRGSAIELPPGQYPAGSIQVRQTDPASNVSAVARYEQAVDSRDVPGTPVDPADTDGDGVPDALEAQYGLIVGIKDNDVLARDDLFVLQLYRDGLAREADSSGLAYWVDGLQQLDRAVVVEQFLKTVEVWSHPLVQFYQVVLDRLPDSAGLRSWMQEAESGASLAAIADAFLVSSEFSTRFGELDDQGFIDLLYQQVLDRDADSIGKDYWQDVLASGTSRGEVLLGFVASPENLEHSGQPAAVVVAYGSLLGRMPSEGEYDASLAYLAANGSLQGLVSGLLSSPEYAARFLPDGNQAGDLMTSASAGTDVDPWLA